MGLSVLSQTRRRLDMDFIGTWSSGQRDV